MEDKFERFEAIFMRIAMDLGLLSAGYIVFRLFNWLASGDFDFWLCRMLEKFSE